MKQRPTNNGDRAQKVRSNEYPTDATVPERVPGADSGERESPRRERGGAGEERPDRPRNGREVNQGRPTPQPPLVGDRADNGSD